MSMPAGRAGPPTGAVPGTQWAPPSPQPNRTLWIIGGTLAGIVLVLFVVTRINLILGNSGGGGDPSSPVDAVDRFLQAVQDQDVDASGALLCQEDAAVWGEDDLVGLESYTLGDVEEDGDVTRVHGTIEITGEDEPQPSTFPVIQEDGDWKVCPSRWEIDLNPDGTTP